MLCSWFTLGFSDTLLLLRSEHLLAFSWASPASSWCYALSCLLELPTRSWCVLSSNTFSLPCPGTCQHALDATPLASLEAWRAIFASFCDTLNSNTLLMLRSWLRLRLWHSLDATRWTSSWNSPRCCWRYGPPQSWWYALIIFLGTSNALLLVLGSASWRCGLEKVTLFLLRS